METDPHQAASDAHAAEMKIRYELLSLHTLKLAEKSAEMAVLCPNDEPEKFQRQMATVSKSIWVHMSVERLRHDMPVSLDVFQAAFGTLGAFRDEITQLADANPSTRQLGEDIKLAARVIETFVGDIPVATVGAGSAPTPSPEETTIPDIVSTPPTPVAMTSTDDDPDHDDAMQGLSRQQRRKAKKIDRVARKHRPPSPIIMAPSMPDTKRRRDATNGSAPP